MLLEVAACTCSNGMYAVISTSSGTIDAIAMRRILSIAPPPNAGR